MAAYTFPDGKLTVWHENGQQGREVLESWTTTRIGEAGNRPSTWPLLNEGEVWPKNALLPGVKSTGYVIPEGMAFDPEGQRLWVSFRSWYATVGDPKQWIAAIDYPSRLVSDLVKPSLRIDAQRFGGGLTIIPEAWASSYVEGRRLGLASGGYVSGQRASMGPTFAAMSLDAESNLLPTVLMEFPETAKAVREKSKVARAFPDYGPKIGVGWVSRPEGEVGYWPGGSIRGNGAWVSTPRFAGVLYMSNQPVGNLDYKRQTETFGDATQNVVYFIPEDALSDVALGKRAADSLATDLVFFKWGRGNNGGLSQTARSLCYDPGSGYLWIYYPRVWSTGVEKHPVVAAYKLVDDTRERRQ